MYIQLMVLDQLATHLGAFAGFMGVSIGVYLRLIANSKCPPGYGLLFFGFGAILLLFHPEPFANVNASGAVILKFLGAVLAILFQVVTAGYVIRHYRVESPVDVFKDLLNGNSH